jgi:hypothetical protein
MADGKIDVAEQLGPDNKRAAMATAITVAAQHDL